MVHNIYADDLVRWEERISAAKPLHVVVVGVKSPLASVPQ